MTDLDAVLRAEERLATAGMMLSFVSSERRQLLDTAGDFFPLGHDDYEHPQTGRWGTNHDIFIYRLSVARELVAAARTGLSRDTILEVTRILVRP